MDSRNFALMLVILVFAAVIGLALLARRAGGPPRSDQPVYGDGDGGPGGDCGPGDGGGCDGGGGD